MNKGKAPSKGTREEKKKDQSPNKRTHPEMETSQWGALIGENRKPRTQTHHH